MDRRSNELAALREENRRLIRLLEAHGIEWRVKPAAFSAELPTTKSHLSTTEKLALFRSFFRGRTDVYPVRWESKSSGKSGYVPACANEWVAGICEKPRIKCGECRHRELLPVSNEVIYAHLAGTQTLGVYPLLPDDRCFLLAVDFDEAEWRADARAFMQSCSMLGVPAALEISRSGAGAHVWVFFEEAVSARDVRRLGSAIISHVCARTRQLELSSYDRIFPSQDTLPKGGFGNLIALPLQKLPRQSGRSVFVDDNFQPYADQWSYLAGITRMKVEDIEPTILQASPGTHSLDVTFIEEEDLQRPWERDAKRPISAELCADMPKSLSVTLANLIYVEKRMLPQALANRLIRLAAFQNPEFYKAQALRLPAWDKPRVIGCAENFPQHIALPRGCFDAVMSLLQDCGIGCELHDERFAGSAIEVAFQGTLRADQHAAIRGMLQHDIGVLCAPTAFGKTVTAAALIAERGVNTLILVHRTELLQQWRERLQTFLKVGKETVGSIGGGKAQLTGKIDIAVMQSLSRRGEVNALVAAYGQVIVDECHHIGAASFESILKQTKAKHVVGLTATPVRRDGQQPIIFMQCGPVRHTAVQPTGAPRDLLVLPITLPARIELGTEVGIQEVFKHLALDANRTQAIAEIAHQAFAQERRKVLVLTERTEHVAAIANALSALGTPSVALHGRLSKKQRAALIDGLNALPADAPRVLVATGKLVGEGFDHPALDTLILAMPISWAGTLQQYAGRLHREHVGKRDVRIFDFVDLGHGALQRMWEKRQRGYQAMGYQLVRDGQLF